MRMKASCQAIFGNSGGSEPVGAASKPLLPAEDVKKCDAYRTMHFIPVTYRRSRRSTLPISVYRMGAICAYRYGERR